MLAHQHQRHHVPLLTFRDTKFHHPSHHRIAASVEPPSASQLRVGRSVFIRLLEKWVLPKWSFFPLVRFFFSPLLSVHFFGTAPLRPIFSAFPWVKVRFSWWKVFPGVVDRGFRGFPGGKVQVSGWKLGKIRGGTHSGVCVSNWASKLVRFSPFGGHFELVRGRDKWWKVTLGKVRQVLIRIRDLF